MDLSKLPKLSDSPAPPPTDTSPPASQQPGRPYVQPGAIDQGPPRYTLPEVWLSVGLGLILLFFMPNTVKYVHGKLTSTMPQIYPDPTRPFPAKCDFILYQDGTKVLYRNTTAFWSDIAVTAFAAVMIMDGVVLALTRRPGVVLLLFVMTVAATLGNLIYLIKTLDQGLPLLSALAIFVGGYLAMTQWTIYRAATRISGRPTI